MGTEDAPSLEMYDLESYIQTHDAPSLLPRLLYLSKSSKVPPSMNEQASLAYLQACKNCGNVDAWVKHKASMSGVETDTFDPASALFTGEEKQWVDAATKENQSKLTDLDHALTSCKSQLNKTATLNASLALASHQLSVGSFKESVITYLSTFSYCTSSKQTFSSCLSIITACLPNKAFSHVTTQVDRAKATKGGNETMELIKCAGAIKDMAEGR